MSEMDSYFDKEINIDAYGKEKCEEDLCERGHKLPNPVYVAGVETGYYQAKNNYYKGMADITKGAGVDYLYFVLENPEKSEVNILVNAALYTNFSNVPLKVFLYFADKPKGKYKVSDNIDNSNTTKKCSKPKGRILSAKNVYMDEKKSHYAISLNAYDNYKATYGGNIILAPGESFIVEMSAIDACKKFKAVASFVWWEEKVKSYK